MANEQRADTPKAEKKFKWVPTPLKELYDGAKVWIWAALITVGVLSYFLGEQWGKIAGAIITCAVILLWLIPQLIPQRWKQVQKALAILESDAHKNDPEYIAAARGVRSVRLYATMAACFSVAAVVAIAYYAIPSAWHQWQSRKPDSIEFAHFTYYKLTAGKEPPEEDAFKEALVRLLKKEGVAAGKPFRVALGETQPLGHYTPEFRCSMEIKGNVEATGYAFRLHDENGRTLYEPIPAAFPTKKTVIFKVPPCKTGDRMFVVARVLPPNDSAFPTNLTEDTVLKVLKKEK